MKDKNKKEEFKEEINHEDHKENCDKNCHCHDGEKCSCDENCKCEDCECFECAEEAQSVDQYLALAQRVQADFENYRRRMADQLVLERQEGARSVIDVFLPCLDTFKEAKKSITDEKVLEGVNMIENKIVEIQLYKKKIMLQFVCLSRYPVYHRAFIY